MRGPMLSDYPPAPQVSISMIEILRIITLIRRRGAAAGKVGGVAAAPASVILASMTRPALTGW
jgi:hypothetical protein